MSSVPQTTEFAPARMSKLFLMLSDGRKMRCGRSWNDVESAMPVAVNVLGKCWVAAFDPLDRKNKKASETVENIGFRGFSHVPPVGFDTSRHKRCNHAYLPS